MRRGWMVMLVVCLAGPLAGAAETAPSPTGRSPKLLWTPERQAVWNRLRAENHPWWQQIKNSAEVSGTDSARYGDVGLWATVAYQVTGDPAYAQKAWQEMSWRLRTTSPPGAGRNFTREYFADFVWMYDWLKPALSASQRQQFIDTLNYWGDLTLNRVSGVSWGTRTGDSDETTGHYFGLAFLALATADENPRAGEFLSTSLAGGLVATAADRKTMRNAIKDYVRLSEGGVWVESSQYNLGTLQLLLIGAEGVRMVTSEDFFPEVTALRPQIAAAQMHELSGDLRQPYQWGDVEAIRSLRLYARMPLLGILAGLLQGDAAVGPVFHGLTKAIEALGPSVDPSAMAQHPNPRTFVLGNPHAPTAEWRMALPKGHYAAGQGLLFFHDGWGTGDSFFGAHMASRVRVDHEVEFFGNVQLYRKNEWALTHPIGYETSLGEWSNAMLLAGLSSMKEARGPVAQEFGSTGEYAYLVGANGGSRYWTGYYDPPPRFLHEWTRSILYLPSTDRRVDTIVIFDRVNAQDPEALTKFTRYEPGDQSRIKSAPALKQWIVHMPVSPSLTSDAVVWTTSKGQRVEVTTLLPANAQRTIYDEKVLGVSGTMVSSEKKFQVRIAPPTERQWDTFLHVVHASGGDVALRSSVIRSAEGVAEGALLERQNHNDTLVLFNAVQSPNLPPLKKVDSRLSADLTLLDQLKKARLLTSGYQVSWAAGTSATDVYLADLDPAKAWTIRIDAGGEAPLTVSSQGLGRVRVPGAGSHGLQVRAVGEAADTTAPSLSNIRASNVSATGATISWATDEPANSQVEYGASATYGARTNLEATLQTTHAVLVSDLAAGTVYHFRARSVDAAGNAAVSVDGTFQTSATPPESNQPPLLDPIGSRAIAEGNVLALTLSAVDPEGDSLTYAASNLPSGAELIGSTFVWTPSFEQAGTYAVTFTVSDGTLSDAEAISVIVENTNRSPTANAGSDQTVEGDVVVTLDGTASADPDADTLTYRWTQTAGPAVILHNPPPDRPTFTAPVVSEPTDVTFTLTVSDGTLSHEDTVTVRIQPASRLITQIAATNGRAYGWGRAASGARLYIDRSTYTFTLIPAPYAGQEYILTANDDRYRTTATALTFTLTANGTVFVAFDARATKLPAWMDSTWVKTGEVIETIDGPRRVYRKVFPAGSVTLGGNAMSPMTGAGYQYLVLAMAGTFQSPHLITDLRVSTGKLYERDALVVGESVYLDRAYTFTSIPASYIGREFIRTANEDKWTTSSRYLTFTLTADATVFVAFDARATKLPAWMDSTWVNTGDTIETSQVPFRVYRKVFPAGPVVLGGNAMSPMQGAESTYTVIAIPASGALVN